MAYVHLSRTEAETRRIEEEWGSLQWLAGRALTGSDITVGRVTIRAGQSNPRHTHQNCTEVLYLLSGTLEHTVGEETVITYAGDTLIVPAGVRHVALNIGTEDADMIVAYPSGERGFEVD
jgi:quercetin dioxygenase-like cupin family protein